MSRTKEKLTRNIVRTRNHEKAEYHARQAQYNDSLKQGDREFLALLERLDRFNQDIESTRHTKIRVKQWLDKLCEPMSSVEWRRNRNAYARLLLKQLQDGELSEPFTKVPDLGPLQTLPTYLLVRAPRSPTFKVVSSPRRRQQSGFSSAKVSSATSRPRVSSQRSSSSQRLTSRPARESKFLDELDVDKNNKYDLVVTSYDDGDDDDDDDIYTGFGDEQNENSRSRLSNISGSSAKYSPPPLRGGVASLSYWQGRAEAAEKKIRALEAHLQLAESELETERTLRAKEKHRLHKLHEAEVKEIQRLHELELGKLHENASRLSFTGDAEALNRSGDMPDASTTAFLEYLDDFEASTHRLISGS